MQNKLHRSITIFMAFLVLLSSTGFALIEHQCMMRGKSVQFVAKNKTASGKVRTASSCCAKSKKETISSKGTFIKKTDCCKESQKFEKLDVASSASHIAPKILKAWTAEIPPMIFKYAFIHSEWTLPASSTPDYSFSSRFHGRSLRCQIQSFLI